MRIRGGRIDRRSGAAPPENVEWMARVTALLTAATVDACVSEAEEARAWLDADHILEVPGGELEWTRR